MITDITKTGVPRSSPITQPLAPLSMSPTGHNNNNSAIPGQPGGYLDLSGIAKVSGTNRAGMFVSTAVTTEGSHFALNNNDASSPYNQNRPSSGGAGSGRKKKQKTPKQERFEKQQELLHQRSPAVSTAQDIRNDADLQMRFAASVLPSGRRSVQPLPDFLDSSYGFRAVLSPSTTSATEDQQQQEQNNNNNNNNNTANQTQNYLSTTTSSTAFSPAPITPSAFRNQQVAESLAISFSKSNHEDDNDTTTTISSINAVTPHHQRNHNNSHHHSNIRVSDSTSKPTTTRSSRRRSQHDHDRLYAQHTLRDSLSELHQKNYNNNKQTRPQSSSRRNPSANNKHQHHQQRSSSRNTSNHNVRSPSRNNNNTKSPTRLTGKANHVVCCPEEHATQGHLAHGIVIGTCEKQAMERYLQVSRELELEKEARANDKWKAELELVKALNKSQELEKQVQKLTEIAENPKPLHEARILRNEFETRWRNSQKRVEELEEDRQRWGQDEQDLRLQLMKKEHECEGLKAAVSRMESTDKNHEDDIAQWRKKWYDEKADRQRVEEKVKELEKQVGRVTYENKSLRGAIRGLEQRLVLNKRREKASAGGKSPRPDGGLTAQGAARNAASSLSNPSSSTSNVQLADLDAAVRVLMHAYSSPSQSPLRHNSNNSNAGMMLMSSGRRAASAGSGRRGAGLGKEVLSYLSEKGEKKMKESESDNNQKHSSKQPKPSGLDNLMIRTSETSMAGDSPSRKL